MSSSTLKVQVVSARTAGYFEGIVNVDGLRPTKLQKKSEDSTQFQTRSALITAAKTIAKKLGFNNVKIIEKGNAIVKKAWLSTPPAPRRRKRTV